MNGFYYILSMAVFGTIGIFSRYIDACIPSSFIAFFRGTVGSGFLILLCIASKKKLSFKALNKKLFLLILSGAFIGINWVFLFEAYRYTTVSTATLCYYMAPVFIIILSPVILKEKLTVKKLFCVGASLLGMIFVSGIVEEGIPHDIKGILFGLGAAVFYSLVVLLNKKIGAVPKYEKTVVQLFSGAVAILPYVLFTVDFSSVKFDLVSLGVLILVSFVHTGIAYYLYFGSIENISSQSVAVLSYIDPAVAVILSALVLREKITSVGILGAVLIIGSAFVSEFSFGEKKRSES